MSTDVVWSQLARADLLEIYVTIALENPSAAERVFSRIEDRVRRLGRHPRMGQRRRDVRPSVRVLVEAPYLILYETVPDANAGPIDRVEVVRILHGRRDLMAPEPAT